MNPFVNQIDLDIPADSASSRTVQCLTRLDISVGSLEVRGLVTETEQAYLVDRLAEVDWLPVGVTGMRGGYTEGDPIGSWRASVWAPDYAGVLWERLAPLLPAETFNTAYPTDHEGAQWVPVGVSPLLRFIRYTDGGALVAHYDAPYISDETTRTLKSLVIYLRCDASLAGGQTRFLVDPQAQVPVGERDLSDGQVLAADAGGDRVRVAVDPVPGSAVVFPHRVWHDSAPTTGAGEKIIARTDLVYARR